MSEILYTGTLSAERLTQLIAACAFPPEARFLGEQLPDYIVSDGERENLLLFTWYASSLPFSNYTTGRIFQRDGELRWERIGRSEHGASTFQIVYLGSEQYTNILQAHHCEMQSEFTELINDEKLEQRPYDYVLFGKFLATIARQIATPENHLTYAEARIPRLLHYPLHATPSKPGAERIRIRAIQYIHTESGQLFAYRFQSLQAMADPAANKGA